MLWFSTMFFSYTFSHYNSECHSYLPKWSTVVILNISLSGYPFSFSDIILLSVSKALQSCGYQWCRNLPFFIICMKLICNFQVCLLHWLSKRFVHTSLQNVIRNLKWSDAVILKYLLSGYHFTLYIRISFGKLSLILCFLKNVSAFFWLCFRNSFATSKFV